MTLNTESQAQNTSETKEISAAQAENFHPLSTLTQDHVNVFCDFLKERPLHLLEFSIGRRFLAETRLKQSQRDGTIEQKVYNPSNSFAPNVISYNLETLYTSVGLERPKFLIQPITGIEKVWRNLPNLDVLSIGPRSEIEIFLLLANGFSLDRIRALDLISYSPYVDLGDMHDMPYEDNSFDITIAGWVMSYSSDAQQMADEIMRTSRPGGIVAIACDYSDMDHEMDYPHDCTHVTSSQQILDYFGDRVKSVYFRQDPERPQSYSSVAIFELF